jgi:hypothetical protein
MRADFLVFLMRGRQGLVKRAQAEQGSVVQGSGQFATREHDGVRLRGSVGDLVKWMQQSGRKGV